ncbi:RNA polymerase sigma factor [Flavisolibacter tropicus]|uniref:RNA polymerase subunit sigma-24 n=1 Tax=Flavisolibacter tropicus TaxID=1492898 RepID=A0A172U2S7_9BACT|nr:RNA polymerase sigma factor [Flavisolibacter tropicus]ANE53620.1 RNA polymerase subunit sigma-24 [Flavisolibacter tropicus]
MIEGCLANDRKAQKLLYEHLYEFAMTIALRYSRDEMDAADIMSHAFVKVFKSIRTFDSSKGSLHAWIKRIVVNEGLDHIKSRNRFSENVELETVAEPGINNSVLERMGAEEIMKLIQKLPPATHAVFVLYAVEGYNHREIAERLNISEGTSKWHLSEARKTLQQQLTQLNT